ncbi:MAG: hypothetical protein IPQ04_14555 [Saprospiraceae bacterium]|nr:hypothetical protein [Saprospiraceae bacterium]
MQHRNACGGTANGTVTVGTTSASGCDITTSCVRTFTVLPAPVITFVCERRYDDGVMPNTGDDRRSIRSVGINERHGNGWP